MDESKKALIIYLVIWKALEMDVNFNYSTFKGRANLYCLLMIHKLGKATVKEQVDLYAELDDQDKDFAATCCINFVSPESLHELNLRLHHLWSATTPLHTLAMEGGKRQVCSLWNDLNKVYQEGPIKSFFELDTQEILTHRLTTSPQYDKKSFKMFLNDYSEKYYSRAGVPIRSFNYVCKTQLEAMTVKLTKKAEDASKECVKENTSAETKDIYALLNEVLLKVALNANIVNTVISPTADEINGNQHILKFEKDPLKHFVFVARHLVEEFIKDPSLQSMFEPLKERFEIVIDNLKGEYSEKVVDKEKKAFDNIATRTNPAKDYSPSEVIEIAAVKTLVDHPSKRTEKWHHKNFPNYDVAIHKSNLVIPHNLSKTKSWSPTNVEFFYAFFGWWNTATSTLPIAPTPATWKPKEHTALVLTFACSVYDVKSGDTFTKMIENNGKKNYSGYKGTCYMHDVMSEVPFDDVSFFYIFCWYLIKHLKNV